MAEVWFDSEEDLMAVMNSQEGQRLSAALLEDEQHFIDHAKSTPQVIRLPLAPTIWSFYGKLAKLAPFHVSLRDSFRGASSLMASASISRINR